ncbi:MAG TPA: hypothetical protein VGP64_15270 [Polyangia bacterium]|jgi:hypothetical protein
MASTMRRNSFTRLGALIVLGVAMAAAGPAAHAAPPPAAPDITALTAERIRLRGELDRVNAEIDTLKKTTRGVGDEYRLHARMADAEALARRLIDIEARLGLRAPASKPGPLPVAAPTDGPSDLEAKADILADQSRRIRLEADALDRRVGELKGRQTLRRRAADLDRDPFAPLEGSKRRVANIAGDSGTHASSIGPTPTGNTGTPPPERPTITVGGTGASGGVSITNNGAFTTTGTSQSAGAMPTPIAGTPTTALTLELRDLLDPATVADIRRLEGAKGPAASVQALERAVTALRARAEALDGQARTMRTTARTPR